MKPFVPFYRPASSDEIIWQGVFFQDEYRIPQLSATDLVIDVGAHSGAFTCASLARGAARVIAFEPDDSSAAVAQMNISRFRECSGLHAEVTLQNSAVWRSDRLESLHLTKPSFSNLTNSLHFAAQTTLFCDVDTMPVRSIGLDDVLEQFPAIQLLKLDCEGAEWPILLTSRRLNIVQRLFLEVHSLPWKCHEHCRENPVTLFREFGRYSLEDLKCHLQQFGLVAFREEFDKPIPGNPDYCFGKLWFQQRGLAVRAT